MNSQKETNTLDEFFTISPEMEREIEIEREWRYKADLENYHEHLSNYPEEL